MQAIEATPPDHRCTAHAVGLVAVFRCAICSCYDRRINMVTGDTTVVGLNQFSHGGVNEMEAR